MSTADKLNYTKTNIDKLKSLTQKTVLREVVTDIEQNYGNGSSRGNVDEYFNSTLGTNANYVFNTLVNKIPFNFNTSNVTNMYYMFYYCSNLTELDLSNFDTSNATNMSYMFGYCSKLSELNLSNFNTSNVTDMSSMFYRCLNLTELDLSNFDTSKVTNIGSMFSSCSKLTELDLSTFDTSNATNINDMFSFCSALQKIKGTLNVIKITATYSINRMLNGCSNLESVNIKNLNASGLDLTSCSKLSHDSLMYLINNAIASDTVKTLTLGKTNLIKLSDDEIAIATEKGWTLA